MVTMQNNQSIQKLRVGDDDDDLDIPSIIKDYTPNDTIYDFYIYM